ncbi:general negative regulator of transcription subunit 5 [Dimargaris cristalligena]|nr:general negative regulator of transcription subunit 5 [Dimargaris cristalligena]
MSGRKLQGEIDKLVKRVAEGIESFEDIFDNLQSTPNINQKEKYEQDLKKEIKKLQRHRDQIKTWIASNEIKDKRELIENRKMIEKKMETFKACEKEMKTKAYSKEGLSQTAKLDPKEKAKLEVSNWISSIVDQLNTQIDILEAEAEGLSTGPKKGKKDSNKASRIKGIERQVDRHKWHIQRLELMLRSMENGRIEPDEITEIQEDVQYYVDCSQDDDFEEDEGIYDDLGLSDVDEFGLNDEYYMGPNAHEQEEERPIKSKEKEPSTPDQPASAKSSPKIAEPPIPETPAPTPITTTGTTGRSTIKLVGVKTTTASTAFPAKRTSTVPLGSTTASSPAKTGTSSASLDTRPSTKSDTVSKPETNAWAANTNAAAKLAKLVASTPVVPMPTTPTSATAPQPYSSVVSSSLPPSSTTSQPATPVVANMPSPSITDLRSPMSSAVSHTGSTISQSASSALPSREASVSMDTMGRSGSMDASVPPTPTAASTPLGIARPPPVSLPGPATHTMSASTTSTTATTTSAADASYPPLDYFKHQDLGAAFDDLLQSLEEAPGNQSWNSDPHFKAQMTETSFQCLPDLADSEKPRQYVPQTPAATPSYYPQVPLPIFDGPAMASNFNLDTLFFIFYYQQDTYQHYLAAQELQRQSWRFHKRYLTWFQRHEKPKLTTDEYEIGTYVFFDYEGGWCPRQKSDFKEDLRECETFKWDHEGVVPDQCRRIRPAFTKLTQTTLAVSKTRMSLVQSRGFSSALYSRMAAPASESASTPAADVTPLDIPVVRAAGSQDKLKSIVGEIEKLTLLETADLVDLLKARFNIKDMGVPMMAAAAPTAASSAPAAEEKAPEKTEFKVKLEAFDAASKAKVIREIKGMIPNINLVEAKKFVEGAPKVIKESASKEEAEKIKKTLEALGATVVLE